MGDRSNQQFNVYFGAVSAVTSGTPGEISPEIEARYDWFARNIANPDDTISGADELPHRINEGVDVRVAEVGSPVVAAFVNGRKVFSMLFAESTPHDECEEGGG